MIWGWWRWHQIDVDCFWWIRYLHIWIFRKRKCTYIKYFIIQRQKMECNLVSYLRGNLVHLIDLLILFNGIWIWRLANLRRWYIYIARSSAQRHSTCGQKKCCRKCTKYEQFETSALENYGYVKKIHRHVGWIRSKLWHRRGRGLWLRRRLPAKKTVANANEAHMPHFRLGNTWESLVVTATTFGPSPTADVRCDPSALMPNGPCSSSSACDWLLNKNVFFFLNYNSFTICMICGVSNSLQLMHDCRIVGWSTIIWIGLSRCFR